MTEATTSARRLTAAQRRTIALEQRKRGRTFQQIGSLLGISRQAAHKLVKTELDRLKKQCNELAEETRTLELLRLDSLQFAFWGKATRGDTKACHQVLKVMERRSKLLGLDQQEIDKRDLDEIRAFKSELKSEIELQERFKIFRESLSDEEREAFPVLLNKVLETLEQYERAGGE
jgi:hypothetical protein